MGLFGDLKNLYKMAQNAEGAVQDVVSGVGDLMHGRGQGLMADGTKFLQHVTGYLQGAVGLGVGLGELPVGGFHDLDIVKSANSPPLVAGESAIGVMQKTTGFGQPEDGDEFEKSAKLFGEGVDILVDAKPLSDRWDGSASQAYEVKRDEHQHRVSDMNVADEALQHILLNEAEQVKRTRQTLHDMSQYLYDFGVATSVLTPIPGGYAVKIALDAAAASVTVGDAAVALTGLVHDSLGNASEIRQQTSRYHKAAGEEVNADGSCAPFGDEAGKLPSRLTSNTYDPPAPEKPPAFGPPAKPAGLHTPAAPGATVPGPVGGLPRAGSPALSGVSAPPSHLVSGVPPSPHLVGPLASGQSSSPAPTPAPPAPAPTSPARSSSTTSRATGYGRGAATSQSTAAVATFNSAAVPPQANAPVMNSPATNGPVTDGARPAADSRRAPSDAALDPPPSELRENAMSRPVQAKDDQ